MIPPTDPLNQIRNIPKKIQAKAIQGHVRWLNLQKKKREKNPDQFFHNMQITSEPLCSDPCARLRIQTPMHSMS